MVKKLFLLRKGFWLSLLKIFLLVFVAIMIVVQIPELRYDLGTKQPVNIENLEQLDPQRLAHTVFASLAGSPNFERAFIYQRYGLPHTFFVVEPYNMRLVVRTYEKVEEEWKDMRRFVGRLRPFDSQPFSYAIRKIFEEQFQEQVPENAYFLSLYDVPSLNGWQIWAVSFASILWGVMFFFFFFFRRTRLFQRTRPGISAQAGKNSIDGSGTASQDISG